MPTINLGDVNFRLGADTASLARSVGVLRNFSKTVDDATKSQRENAKALMLQEKMSADALRSVLKFNAAVRASGAETTGPKEAVAAWRAYNKELTEGVRRQLDLQRATMQFRNTMSDLQNKQVQQTAVTGNIIKQERAIQSATRAVIQLNAALSKTEMGKTFVPSANDALSRYVNAVKAAGTSTIAFQRASDTFKNELQQIRLSVSEGAKSMTGLAGSLRRLSQESLLIYGPLNGVTTRIATLASMADSAGTKLAIFFAAFAVTTMALTGLGAQVVSAGKNFQKYQLALEGVTGSQQAANAALSDAKDIAYITGTAYESIIPQYTRFIAATKGTVLQGKEARDIFLSVAKVAGTLQLSVEDTTGVFRALEQMVSKGVVQSEELRGQLGDRLPGAYQIAARAMGVSTAELAKMLKAGEVYADDFLPRFAKELEKTFGTTNLAMIDNYTAAQMRMFNSFTDFFLRINELTNLTGKVQAVFNAIADAMEFLTAHLEDIGKIVLIVMSAFTQLLAARIYAGFLALAAAIANVAKSLVALNGVLMLPALGSFVRLAIMAATALYLYHDQITAVTGALKLFIGIAASAASFFAGAWVAGALAAAAGTSRFAAALTVLRAALIRTGIGLLIVLVVELVFWFMRLVEAAGGFGNALNLLARIVVEFGQRFIDIHIAIAAMAMAKWYAIQAMILGALVKVLNYINTTFVNKMIGAFVGVAKAIIAAWDGLPAAMQDVAVMAMNGVIDTIQSGVTEVIGIINSLLTIGGKYPDMAIEPPDLSNWKGVVTGAASNLGSSAADAFSEAFNANYVGGWTDSMAASAALLEQQAIAWQSMADEYLAKGLTVPPSLQELIDKMNALSESASEVVPPVTDIGTATETAMGAAGGAVQEAIDKYRELRDAIKSSIEDAMMAIVERQTTVIGAFKQMASAIIKELYRVLVVQKLVGSWGLSSNPSGGTGILGFISKLLPASWLPVSPTASGGKRKKGQRLIVGEKGPEEIILGDDAYVRPNNEVYPRRAQLPTFQEADFVSTPQSMMRNKTPTVQQNVTNINITQNLNFATGISQTVRGEIMALLPKIMEASKVAVLDAAQRGGRFGKIVGQS